MFLVIFVLISMLLIPVLYLFVGLQVISLGDYVRSGFKGEMKLLFDVYRFREYPEFFMLVVFLIGATILIFLANVLFVRSSRNKTKSRILSIEERKRVSRITSRHEAKKGTQRLEFNARGESLGNRTFLGIVDEVFDPLKKMWNKVVVLGKLSDVHKCNTLHYWKIGDEITCRRGGPPILTWRRRIWVDGEDTHSLVVGTTRSGKTFSIVNILIQSLRMAGESMIIMDVKGELYKTHGQSLINDGYDVKVVDFINPKKSERWNPFGIIIKKYRQAYDDYLEEMKLPENKKIVDEIGINKSIIRKKKKEISNSDKNHDYLLKQIKVLEQDNKTLEEMLPKPNYSEAQELIADIAFRLCHEEDARDPFWSSSATTLLEGYVNFLLEERRKTPEGKLEFLPDEMINMYSVRMLHDMGKTRIDPKLNDNCSTILEYYLKHYRKPTDQSYMKLIEYVDAPDNTRGSISSVFSDKIKYFLTNEDILRMTSVSDFELKQLGERKSAIFIGIHDEKGTYHELPSILISQTYEELIKLARNETETSRLKVPVYVVWDEFANGARWDNIVNALTAGLSRGVRFCLVIQDFAQLDAKYGKDKANTIRSNCQNLYYLLAGEYSTLKDISELCGSKIIWNRNKQEKEIVPVLSTDALSKLSMGEVVIKRQRMNPIDTRLRSFDRYSFKLPKTPDREVKNFPPVALFNLMDVFNERKKKSKPDTVEKEELVNEEEKVPDNSLNEPEIKQEEVEIIEETKDVKAVKKGETYGFGE